MRRNRGFEMALPARFERATIRLEGGCSIQLSYGSIPFSDADSHNDNGQLLARVSKGSGIPASAKPLARSRQAGQVPHGGTLPL